MQAEKALILGGTAEAVTLAQDLHRAGVDVITSLAGRTAQPAPLHGLVRIGGFGGAEGLAQFLVSERISHVYDATHPFATRISANAVLACQQTGISLTVLTRAPWQKQPGDQWLEVETLNEAASLLPEGATVFLALGRQYIDAFATRTDCRFVLRMVDPPQSPLPFEAATIVLGKAQADWEQEKRVLQTHAITHLVARNSGGEASYGKIMAARHLGVTVIMIGRKQEKR